jgi:hypothetical protein
MNPSQITNGIMVGGVLMKRCPRCEEELALSEFGVCRARPDGMNLYCKGCIRQKISAARASRREYNQVHGLKGDEAKPVEPTIEQRMKELQPLDRVREAIREGAQTRAQIIEMTKLRKGQVCECLAHLLLYTREISTEIVGATRFYFEREKAPGELKPAPIADGGMDAGLLMLSLITPREFEWELQDIAFVCGCTPEAIRQIEEQALAKLRRRFPMRMAA